MSEKITLPIHVAACCEALRRAGHRACPVGGCVRDSLLGRTPGDWDVAVSARPEEIMALFPRTVFTGGAHGTVTVLTGGGPIEVTPFRREGSYSDGRHPDEVVFGVSLEEDLARRDFTVNAMALDEGGNIVDLFGGREDLDKKVIRCVGQPERRFREDALRMFRAVRFSAQLGFEIEAGTLAAIGCCAPLAGRLSAERVGAEMEKTLCARQAPRAGLWFELGLLSAYTEKQAAVLDLSGLSCLPSEPPVRWAGLCEAMTRAEVITDAGAFLKKLRRDNRTVRLCAGAMELLRDGCPADGRGWRRALARYGEEACRMASLLAGDTVLARTLAERPCVQVGDLALSGGDLAALGLAGKAIGEAQRALLDRVLDRPEDNTRSALRGILEELGHI